MANYRRFVQFCFFHASQEWFRRGTQTSPLTNLPLDSKASPESCCSLKTSFSTIFCNNCNLSTFIRAAPTIMPSWDISNRRAISHVCNLQLRLTYLDINCCTATVFEEVVPNLGLRQARRLSYLSHSQKNWISKWKKRKSLCIYIYINYRLIWDLDEKGAQPSGMQFFEAVADFNTKVCPVLREVQSSVRWNVQLGLCAPLSYPRGNFM